MKYRSSGLLGKTELSTDEPMWRLSDPQVGYYPFMCRDGHEEIGFKVEAPNGDERCPLCLLRDQVILEIAQPHADYERFSLELSSLALRSYPFIEEDAASEGGESLKMDVRRAQAELERRFNGRVERLEWEGDKIQ